ncbi:MAG: hemerythrin domain-containing protein [Brumimicrobium sp.]
MESQNTQLERDEALKSFNNDHHHALLLCWKIRKGLNGNIDLKRIKKYNDWYYNNHLKQLLEDEEKFLFPILGEDNKLIKKTLAEHRRLRRLFKDTKDIMKSINYIEEELDRNIRFKERELFVLIQEHATIDQLQNITKNRKEIPFEENTEDEFWEEG